VPNFRKHKKWLNKFFEGKIYQNRRLIEL
jgi:hypothetical protein